MLRVSLLNSLLLAINKGPLEWIIHMPLYVKRMSSQIPAGDGPVPRCDALKNMLRLAEEMHHLVDLWRTELEYMNEEVSTVIVEYCKNLIELCDMFLKGFTL